MSTPCFHSNATQIYQRMILLILDLLNPVPSSRWSARGGKPPRAWGSTRDAVAVAAKHYREASDNLSQCTGAFL